MREEAAKEWTLVEVAPFVRGRVMNYSEMMNEPKNKACRLDFWPHLAKWSQRMRFVVWILAAPKKMEPKNKVCPLVFGRT